MEDEFEDFPLPLLILFLISLWGDVEDALTEARRQQDFNNSVDIATTVVAAYRASQEELDGTDGEPPPKRRMKQWDRARALASVMADYWGPEPLFADRDFERVFRVTKGIMERLLLLCGNQSPFFRHSEDALGKPSISPIVKLLFAMKTLAYGVSPSAFQDYFQMGESTGRKCLKQFCACICADDEIQSIFLRRMNRGDAKRVSDLHLEKHGIAGMIGSLDCSHVGWKNCPVAWQGQFKGKEGKPTLVMEAICDYNLWFWHAAFGFPGTQNDINIWDQSVLLRSFIDGTFASEVDFEFQIGGTNFHRLWILVDGIYPELSRFVKTISEPITEGEKNYAAWQESKRKDVERGFGVLQRKFHFLKKDVELWYLDELVKIIQTTITIHNMMVQVRMERGEQENESWYDVVLDDDDDDSGERVEPEIEMLQQGDALAVLQRAQEEAYYRGEGVMAGHLHEHQTWCDLRQRMLQQRWQSLYNQDEHLRLRNAIIAELEDQVNAFREQRNNN